MSHGEPKQDIYYFINLLLLGLCLTEFFGWCFGQRGFVSETIYRLMYHKAEGSEPVHTAHWMLQNPFITFYILGLTLLCSFSAQQTFKHIVFRLLSKHINHESNIKSTRAWLVGVSAILLFFSIGAVVVTIRDTYIPLTDDKPQLQITPVNLNRNTSKAIKPVAVQQKTAPPNYNDNIYQSLRNQRFIIALGVVINAIVCFFVLFNLPVSKKLDTILYDKKDITPSPGQGSPRLFDAMLYNKKDMQAVLVTRQPLVGLYNLEADQYLVYYDRDNKPGKKVIQGPKLVYKEAGAIWFVHSPGREVFKEHYTIRDKYVSLSCSWTIAHSDPKITEIENTTLTRTSVPAFFQVVEDSRNVFAKQVYETEEYKKFIDLLLNLPLIADAKDQGGALTVAQWLNYETRAHRIKVLMDGLPKSLMGFKKDYYCYGNLYKISFQCNEVYVTSACNELLADYMQRLEKAYDDTWSRTRELSDGIARAVDATAGIASHEARVKLINSLTDTVERMAASVSVSPNDLASDQKDTRNNDIDSPINSPLATSAPKLLTSADEIRGFLRRIEPNIKNAFDLYGDSEEAIKSILLDLNIARKLSSDDKNDEYDRWRQAKEGKMNTGDANIILAAFLRELQSVGHIIIE